MSIPHFFFSDSTGSYLYTPHLLALNGGFSSAYSGDARLASVSTPLQLEVWRRMLQNHPDADFAKYILCGIEHGFHIGIQQAPFNLKSSRRNMSSAISHPQVIEEYIGPQVGLGNILGPFQSSEFPEIHVNRFGCIPKKHQPGKWRLITDLSFPKGRSVNDLIDPRLCSLSYITVEEVARKAMSLGPGSLMAKIDIRSAYRLIPIHPADRYFLGMIWDDMLYVDGMLPFGLCSAPKIFTAWADALEWCIGQQGVEHIFHYLDDFIVLGPPDSTVCKQYLDILERICALLGVPLAAEKKDGPTWRIIFLGIIIDTLTGELSLPKNKLERLLREVDLWAEKRWCTRKELESLIGSLQHACKVIRPGRSFLRRAISLLSVTKKPDGFIRLNKEFRSDLMWWKVFARGWNGTGIISRSGHWDVMLTSDASGSWGCGAWCEQDWFQLEWSQCTKGKSIAVKELIPIVIAAAIWGPQWRGKMVCARCDNGAVVAVLQSRSSRDTDLMQLLRCLWFFEALHQFQLVSQHIPGVENTLADDLSRNRLGEFMDKAGKVNDTPSFIPPSLLQWLLAPQQDWTSQNWTSQFSTFVGRV